MSGAHVAIHAANEANKKKQLEEEEMTPYTDKELIEDFEFKIVRSTTEAFKKRETVEQVIAEEAISGWILVEKFDNGRLRFKRPASARRKDAMLPPGIDPYRTQYGMGEGQIALVVLGVLVFLGGLIGSLIWLLG